MVYKSQHNTVSEHKLLFFFGSVFSLYQDSDLMIFHIFPNQNRQSNHFCEKDLKSNRLILCVCGGGGGGGVISSYNLPVVIPGYLAMAMLKVRHGTVGVAFHPVPCISLDVQKP